MPNKPRNLKEFVHCLKSLDFNKNMVWLFTWINFFFVLELSDLLLQSSRWTKVDMNRGLSVGRVSGQVFTATVASCNSIDWNDSCSFMRGHVFHQSTYTWVSSSLPLWGSPLEVSHFIDCMLLTWFVDFMLMVRFAKWLILLLYYLFFTVFLLLFTYLLLAFTQYPNS